MSDSISVGIADQENKHRIFSEVVFDLRMTSIHFECASTSIKNKSKKDIIAQFNSCKQPSQFHIK